MTLGLGNHCDDADRSMAAAALCTLGHGYIFLSSRYDLLGLKGKMQYRRGMKKNYEGYWWVIFLTLMSLNISKIHWL
jgi:hypothetical protein